MRKKNVLSSALALTLLIGMFAVLPLASAGNPGAPPDGASMWIDPDTLSWTTGTAPTTFKVYIWCEIKTDTYTWQMYLTYNKAQLNATSAGYWDGTTEYAPGAGKSQWANGYPTSPVTFSKGSHDATLDYLLLGESLSGAVRQETPGVYRLAWVEFEIVGWPAKYETLTSELRLDLVGVYKSFFLEADYLDEVPMAFGKATYSLQWTMPPKPDVTVYPVETRFFKEPPPSVGKTFNIKVQIKNLDPAWGLHNATFDLFYNPTLIGVVDYAFDPLWAGPNVFNNATPGQIHVEVKNPTATPSGTVNTVTITFVVLYQGSYPAVDESPLDLQNVHLFDTLAEIEVRTITDGKVVIEGLLTLPLPYLEVESVTMGPEPVLGQEFNVAVSIKNLHYAWYLVGVQFRLKWDTSLIEFVSVAEGPFMPYWSSQQNGSLGTFWYGEYWDNGMYGPHVLVGNMIYPNETGWWNPPWPEGEGVIAIITFKVIYQSFGEPDQSCGLDIIEQLWVGLDGPETQNIVEVPADVPVNGTYTITTAWPGRVIDVYGGAVNRGYGVQYGAPSAFPAPYGGQGLNKDMDLVIPQSVVYLLANVTYNYWPVQSKDVGFEIEGPFYQEGWNKTDPQTWIKKDKFFVVKYANKTDENGVAWIKFQMPWPCENPEDYFGKYKVTATVDICGVVTTDVLWFDYYYLLEITKVTTDKFQYNHCEDIEITIKFRTKAQQWYPVLFAVVIQDDLETHFGWAEANITIGGAPFCHWKDGALKVTIHVPKWAFAGIAKIYVSAFDKNPTVGGAPWLPTFGLGWPPDTELPKIAIQPY